MKIQILGPGCPKCEALLKNAKEAAERLPFECEIAKVSDLKVIADHGVLFTPALVVDGKILLSGKVPSAKDLVDVLAQAGREQEK